MSKQFSIGQLVIMQNATYFFEYEEYPAVVVGGLAERTALNVATMEDEDMICYWVEALIEPPMRFFATPHQLRPLRDDFSDTSETSNGKSGRAPEGRREGLKVRSAEVDDGVHSHGTA